MTRDARWFDVIKHLEAQRKHISPSNIRYNVHSVAIGVCKHLWNSGANAQETINEWRQSNGNSS